MDRTGDRLSSTRDGADVREKLPYAEPPSIAPLLRGGRALSQTVQRLVQGSKSEEFGLVRTTSLKHSQSPKLSTPSCAVTKRDPPGLLLLQKPSSLGTPVTFGDQPDGMFQSLSISATPIQQISNGQVADLQRSLSDHEAKLEKMTKQLLRVREERDNALRSNERLRGCVKSHQAMLQTTLEHTQRVLQEQTQVLVKQDTIIQGMVHEQRRESGILNLACVLVSVYVVRTPVMQYTIQLITGYVTHRNVRAKWFPKWFQYIAVLQTYALLKALYKKLGLRSSLGSVFSWFFSRGRRVGRSFFSIGDMCASVLARTRVKDSEETKCKSLHLC